MDDFWERIRTILEYTAGEISAPRSYGLFHISFTLLGFVLSFLAAKRLRNLSDKGSRILLLSLGIFMMVSEVYKQLLYCLVISPGEYSWGDFPFHLCSVPMYLCVIAPLLKPGRIQKAMYSFMMLYNLLGGGIAFAEPSGLLHPYVSLTAHACIWHMLLVFIGLYLMHSGRGGFEVSDYKDATKTFISLCATAFALNLIFRDISNGALNMFFVGPSNSTIIVFKQISETFGWYVSTAIYIPAVCLGAWLIFQLMRFYKAKHHIKKC